MHIRDLIETFRPASFSSRFVRLAIVFFCYNGFCGIISVADLQKRFEVIAKAADGNVGVAVELLETKESILLNGKVQFPMQSVYKLPIGMAVLHEVDKGSLKFKQLIQVTTNDAGIVTLPDGRHMAIAVFVSNSAADEVTRDAVIAKISRAAWDYWVEEVP